MRNVVASALTVVAIAAAWAVWRFGDHSQRSDVETAMPRAVAEPREELIVRLTPAKLEAAKIHVAPVERREVQEMHRVPAKIGYNTSRRLEIKLPASGVVKQVKALPGQLIEQGQPLAILTSVQVGLARDAVIKSEADVHLATHEFQWASQIAKNLGELLTMLDSDPDVPDVESRFKDKLLGDHRDKVVSAYSKLLLAQRAWKGTEAMASRGAISERLVQERESGREVAAAYFKSVCEQARFDAHHLEVRTRADLEHAERVLAVNHQQLTLLLGPFAEIAESTEDDQLCQLVLRSPLTGVVEDRFVSDGVQFVASQSLFAVANTDTLWVSAQIYEREWSALMLNDVKELMVETPALPGKRFTARVQFTGVSISPETHAVPLVAELANPEGQFKPGMFAWVTMPVGTRHEALVVPAEAVMQQDERSFVFVELDGQTFQRLDVTLGITTPDFCEVTRGLRAGQEVVDHGAFTLKSELVLEGEDEP